MRKAISCFALFVFGLPTRVALANSSSVDSGTSLKSILRSEICFALLAGRLSRADDADCFLAIYAHHGKPFRVSTNIIDLIT